MVNLSNISLTEIYEEIKKKPLPSEFANKNGKGIINLALALAEKKANEFLSDLQKKPKSSDKEKYIDDTIEKAKNNLNNLEKEYPIIIPIDSILYHNLNNKDNLFDSYLNCLMLAKFFSDLNLKSQDDFYLKSKSFDFLWYLNSNPLVKQFNKKFDKLQDHFGCIDLTKINSFSHRIKERIMRVNNNLNFDDKDIQCKIKEKIFPGIKFVDEKGDEIIGIKNLIITYAQYRAKDLLTSIEGSKFKKEFFRELIDHTDARISELKGNTSDFFAFNILRIYTSFDYFEKKTKDQKLSDEANGFLFSIRKHVIIMNAIFSKHDDESQDVVPSTRVSSAKKSNFRTEQNSTRGT